MRADLILSAALIAGAIVSAGLLGGHGRYSLPYFSADRLGRVPHRAWSNAPNLGGAGLHLLWSGYLVSFPALALGFAVDRSGDSSFRQQPLVPDRSLLLRGLVWRSRG